jgi:hypothetical protein
MSMTSADLTVPAPRRAARAVPTSSPKDDSTSIEFLALTFGAVLATWAIAIAIALTTR